MIKMRENPKIKISRIDTVFPVPRALISIIVLIQVPIQYWLCKSVCSDVIPKTYALSQLTLITTKQPHFRPRGNGGFKKFRRQSSSVQYLDPGSLVVMYNTKYSTSYVNSTKMNASEARGERVNIQVRNIMSLLEERYDLPKQTGEMIGGNGSKREWKKTRNYMYHATRSQQNGNGGQRSDVVNKFEQQIVTVLDFLDHRLELPPEVSKRVLQESPRILRKPVDSFLIPTADFLIQLWGRDLFVQAVERNPALLLSSGVGYTTNRKSKGGSRESDVAMHRKKEQANEITIASGVEQTVEEILLVRTGLSASAMKQIKRTAPFVFGLEPSKVCSILEFLDSILRQKQDNTIATTTPDVFKRKKTLGKVILAHPYLLNLSVESNLKPRVKFLAESCDLNPAQLAKVVQTSNGSVLSLSVEQNLKPTLDFLLNEIFNESNDGLGDVPRAMLKKCVLTHPQLLGLSISNLKSKVNYFYSIGPSLAVRIARKCPAIYSLNLDQNIVPTIEFLSRIWGIKNETNASKKSNKKNFVSMLHEYPNIITLSVETNLQPTMMFFNKTGYTQLNERWELIQPSQRLIETQSQHGIANGKYLAPSRIRGRYIAASLYNRLLPRWHYCLSSNAHTKNVEFGTESTLSTMPSPPTLETPPLHILVMSSDEAFCQAMNFQLESFLKFKKEAIPRLKFSSQFDTWLKTGKPIDL